jgi:hypothetical protein
MEHSMKRTLAISATAVALLTGGGLLAGCGSDSTASGTTATAADTTAQASNGVETLSGQEIVTKSKAAADSASSVTVSGAVTVSGDDVGLDLMLGDTAASGSITLNNMKIQIRVVDGTTYLKFKPGDLAKIASVDANGAEADQMHGGDRWRRRRLWSRWRRGRWRGRRGRRRWRRTDVKVKRPRGHREETVAVLVERLIPLLLVRTV